MLLFYFPESGGGNKGTHTDIGIDNLTREALLKQFRVSYRASIDWYLYLVYDSNNSQRDLC